MTSQADTITKSLLGVVFRGWDFYLWCCFSLLLPVTPITWSSTEVPSIQDSQTRPSDPRMPLGPQVSPVSGEKLGPAPGGAWQWSRGSGDLGRWWTWDEGRSNVGAPQWSFPPSD